MKSASRDAVLNSVPAQMLSGQFLRYAHVLHEECGGEDVLAAQDWSRAEGAILGTAPGVANFG
jgi:hypothetical protein